jgi:hypothetical protein
MRWPGTWTLVGRSQCPCPWLAVRQLLAEAMLDVAVTAAREAHGISKPQACSIVGADRSAMRYRHRRGSGWTNSSGTPTDGQKFRILVVVDDFTRECLCLVADTSDRQVWLALHRAWQAAAERGCGRASSEGQNETLFTRCGGHASSWRAGSIGTRRRPGKKRRP